MPANGLKADPVWRRRYSGSAGRQVRPQRGEQRAHPGISEVGAVPHMHGGVIRGAAFDGGEADADLR